MQTVKGSASAYVAGRRKGEQMKPYDALGIAIHSSQPTEVERVANEIRDWLNERAERGYSFVCTICSVYAAVVIMERKHNPAEHGD